MYINGYFEGTDGVNLFYRGWIPKNPRALMVLVHGAGEHSGRYSHIGEVCMQNQIAMVAPDLRGFGQSEGPRGHVNHFKEYLDDLETLIRLFHVQYKSLPLFILGHSFGGLIVIRYGQIYPQQAKGVILSSPALGLGFRVPFTFKKMLDFVSWISPDFSIEPFKWTNILRKSHQLKPFFPEQPALEMKDPFSTNEYTARWLTELLHNGIHALSEVSKFYFPTLCLYDQKDPIVNPSLIQQFLDSLTIQDKEYIMSTEGRHRPWQERGSHKVLDNLMSWLVARL